MPVLYYILKLSVCLIFVWAFYQFVLRRLTFYTWNRWFLMICPVLAFLLPLVNISPVLEKNNWSKTQIVSVIPQIPDYAQPGIIATAAPQPTLSEQLLSWLPYIVAIGAAIMLTRLLIQYFSLRAMRRSARLLMTGKIKVYQVDKDVIPFSFGNSIFLNQFLHEEDELREIIRHEFIHVKQRHTIDIIWSEAVCILTWYNPFSWLLRKATRQNLEFIADQQVLQTGLDRREYQYLLLKVIGVPSYSIASNFNFKSLKKRIAMMNKVKSARVHLIRFLLLLPLVAIILVAFRNAAQHRQQPNRNFVIAADTTVPGKKGFPENVRSFRFTDNEVIVELKNGKEERFNLDNKESATAFQKKYGKLPEPPEPPSPAAILLTPVTPDPPLILAAPVADMIELQEQIADIAPPAEIFDQDDCYNDKGYCLSIITTPKGKLVLIVGKKKTENELILLEDWRKDKKYEDKYGKLPAEHHAGYPVPPHAPVPPVNNYPEDVSSIHIKDYDAVVTKKDGTVERLNLKVPADQERYNEIFFKNLEVSAVAKTAIPITTETSFTAHADVLVERPAKVTSDMIEAIEAHAENRPIYSPNTKPHKVGDIREEVIVARITNKSTFKDLEQIKKDLKEKGITVEWQNMKADDGELTMVSGKFSEGGSKCNFSLTNFKTITVGRYTDADGKIGYHVHVTEPGDTHVE